MQKQRFLVSHGHSPTHVDSGWVPTIVTRIYLWCHGRNLPNKHSFAHPTNPTNNFQETTLSSFTSQWGHQSTSDEAEKWRNALGPVTTCGNFQKKLATCLNLLQPLCRLKKKIWTVAMLYKLKNGMATWLKHDASRVEIHWQADAFVQKVIKYWASNMSARAPHSWSSWSRPHSSNPAPCGEAMTMIQWNYAGEAQIFG